MTKANKANFSDVLIAALNATKATSAANAKKKSAIALKLRSETIANFLEKCNVSARDFNDLYLAEKVTKCAENLTSNDLHVSDFNENTFVALKTAILSADANADMTRTQVRATVSDMKLSDDLAKITYRRTRFISTKRQEDLNIRLLESLNIVNARDSKEILKINADSHALNVAKERIAQMTL